MRGVLPKPLVMNSLHHWITAAKAPRYGACLYASISSMMASRSSGLSQGTDTKFGWVLLDAGVESHTVSAASPVR